MPQPPPSPARQLDAVAVNAALRRLARAPDAPWLHTEVARRMAEKLQIILLQPELVLDWWGFLGAGKSALEQAYPKAQRWVVEPDTTWAQRSRVAARRPWWSPNRWSGGGVEVIEQTQDIPPGADLIWANMMLHAVVDPPALFERWQQLLRVEGFVMFSCLGPGTLRELRTLYSRLGWPAPTPGFIDMHDLGDMLVQAGFADPVMDQEIIRLSWSDPQALLRELRLMGGNALPERGAGLRTPRWKVRLEAELMALKAADGRLHLSFEVAYGHAFKALPRARPGGETSVSLDDMRSMARSVRTRG